MTRIATRVTKPLICSRCRRQAPGEIHSANLGPYGAEWIRPPKGFWVLLGSTGPHVRCDECLPGPDDDPQQVTIK